MRRPRADDLFDRIATFGALCAAASRAAAGKRRGPGPAAFLAGLEPEVLALERELQAGTWRPGGYVSFEICDPKRRTISAAPFRDRVVHHAVHAIIAPLFERVHRPHLREPGRQGDAPGGGALRAPARPPPPRAAGRHLSLLPGPRPRGAQGGPAAPHRVPADPGRARPHRRRRFRNRLRGLRDRWRAGTVTGREVEQRVGAWVAHAAHADTWRLRRAIFRDGWFAPRGQPVPGA